MPWNSTKIRLHGKMQILDTTHGNTGLRGNEKSKYCYFDNVLVRSINIFYTASKKINRGCGARKVLF